MDSIDDAILRELTADARFSYSDLGERVGLSPNAAANRVRRLVDDGTIRGFTIVTASSPPARPGTGLEVFVEVRLADGTTNESFTAALRAASRRCSTPCTSPARTTTCCTRSSRTRRPWTCSSGGSSARRAPGQTFTRLALRA